jgi:hypothetical protein
MTDFKALQTTQKGDIGERIVLGLLNCWGFRVYHPGEGSHPIDFLAIDRAGKLTAVDVKTYPRLHSRDQTGIDLADYQSYTRLSKTLQAPVKLFFVDEVEGIVYGQRLDELSHYRTERNGKVYFPLSQMVVAKTLTDAEVLELTTLSNVNYSNYNTMPRYFTNSTGTGEGVP